MPRRSSLARSLIYETGMIRPVSHVIALLGLALLVLHRTGVWDALSENGLVVDVAAALLLALGIAGLLVYGAFGYTSSSDVEQIEPRS